MAFVLIHSPFVGPLCWQPTARALEARGQIAAAPSLASSEAHAPYWPHYAGAVAEAARELPADAPLVLVAHSAAGLVLPAAGAAIRTAAPERAVGAYVFVDATLPHGEASLGELIPPGVGIDMEQLRALADGNGLLPPWGADWPEALWRQLIPDAELRARFAAELRPAPLALFPRWRCSRSARRRSPAGRTRPAPTCGSPRFTPARRRRRAAPGGRRSGSMAATSTCSRPRRRSPAPCWTSPARYGARQPPQHRDPPCDEALKLTRDSNWAVGVAFDPRYGFPTLFRTESTRLFDAGELAFARLPERVEETGARCYCLLRKWPRHRPPEPRAAGVTSSEESGP